MSNASGIDHNSLVDSSIGWREEPGGYGSKPVCKRVPQFNIQRRNYFGGGKIRRKDSFNTEWCIENTSDTFKAREIVADKCPVPYTRQQLGLFG